ncbi:proteasome activator pa28, REG alpha/beta subunit [Cylindrobasidium torrendii FP15055 ss-10]|uniref:Proteasome activator pa28, REG alpha/beta subunit n=1 Tax=Cylindrobasidium torrendii FP15055 ss-10 TaxID=1314674 RepID=A0A0D7BBE8_9AGAR|nr:proteasome activator pa28, REG alpha/beta subunit [Cylindrobasidium torrendii FP15055 ss-10]
MDNDTAARIEAFRTEVAKGAEDVVFKSFPQKILALQQLVVSTSHSNSPFYYAHNKSTTDTTVYPAPDTLNNGPEVKKRKLEDDSGAQPIRHAEKVLSNKQTIDLHEHLKRECEEFNISLDVVKLWITLTMPKIEDGDNFGVQVQEECLSELHRSQESVYNLRDVGRQDYLARAKICSKLIKYPNVEDYTMALREHDEKQLYFARQHLIDLRNLYASLMDLLQKNITKLRAPKSNNNRGMY